MNWYNYVTFSSWLCGGRYVSCIANYKSMQEVLQAVHDKADEQGPLLNSPLVLLNVVYDITQDDVRALLEREGDISIYLE